MSMTKNQNQSRRRRNQQNQTKIATNQKSPKNKKKQKQPKQQKQQQSKNLNIVTIQSSKSKTSAAPPVNWAAQLKPKSAAVKETKSKRRQRRQQQRNERVSQSAPRSSNISLDSSQTACMDADKVRHVLEVFNMTPADYQAVSSIFKHFKIDSFINSLICVKQRWFVVFDCAKSAVRALNVVKNDRFKLKRIDLNVNDVQMLKNNVPPPLRRNK